MEIKLKFKLKNKEIKIDKERERSCFSLFKNYLIYKNIKF